MYSSAWFFARNPVFTAADFAGAGTDRGKRGNESLLAYHVAAGRLARIRRGLYAVVPDGIEPEKFVVDPYLVASKAVPDSVIGYHSAFAFHGLAYTVTQKITFLTAHEDSKPFFFQGVSYQSVQHPRKLLRNGQQTTGTYRHDYRGQYVNVTSLERTLVDCFDRIDLGGGIEENWRSLATITYLKMDDIIHYLMLLDNATTTAKVGFYLEQQQERLMIPQQKLEMLQKQKPKSPRYMFRAKRKGKLVPQWNLIVPDGVLAREWEETV
jgi:predicted transcriptional regulator of viral defense system